VVAENVLAVNLREREGEREREREGLVCETNKDLVHENRLVSKSREILKIWESHFHCARILA